MYKLCVLCVNEIEIKTHIEYSRTCHKVFGFMNMGYGPINEDYSPAATKILMVVAIDPSGSQHLSVVCYLTYE